MRRLFTFGRLPLAIVIAALIASACSDDITTITRASTTTQVPSTSQITAQTTTQTSTSQPNTANPNTTGITVETTTPVPSNTAPTSSSNPDGTTGSTDNTAQPESSTTTTYELGEVAFDSRSRVTTVGIGDVYFGSWFRDAEAAARTEWVGIPEGTIPECLVVTPVNGPEGVEIWLWRGYVERVDISNSDIRTRSGYGLGTSLETLRENLGTRLQETVNTDDTTTAEFIPSDPGDAVFRIVFEVSDEGEVTSYRSGRATLINTTQEDCN